MHYFKRPIVPLLVVLATGIWAGRTVESLAIFLAVVTCAALGTSLWSWRRREPTPSILFVFALLGAWRGHDAKSEEALARHLLQRLAPPISVVVRGIVTDIEVSDRITPHRFTLARCIVETPTETFAMPGQILVSLVARGERVTTAPPTVGQIVEVAGALEPPKSLRNFFGADSREYLARQRIYAVLRTPAYQLLDQTWSAHLGAMLAELLDLRRWLTDQLRLSLPPDQWRWATSLLFNDYRLLLPQEMRALRLSNMMHLFAVSGLHVAAFAGVILAVVRLGGFSWKIAWALTTAVVWAYVAMTGFVPSASRSAMMLTAYAATHWLRREIDPVSALAFACLGMILSEPLYLWQTGFILSVMGVLGIFAVLPLLRQVIPTPDTLRRGAFAPATELLWDGLRVSVGVTVLLLPLQLYFFNQFNLFAPFANVAATALAGPVIGSTMATAALTPLSHHLGVIVASATALLFDLLMAIIRFTADQEWATLRVPQIPLAAVFAYYAVIVSGYYFVRCDTPEFVPKARARLVLHFLAALLPLVFAAAWQRADHRLRLWFFDVDQGDAILVQLPNGQSLLVDTGNAIPNMARLVVIPQLRALGCWPLDVLLLTHEDSDHSGGAPTLLADWRVETLVLSKDFANTEKIVPPDLSLPYGWPRIVRTCAGYRLRMADDLSLEVLNPDCATNAALTSDNNRSLVIRIDYKNFSALLTGDAETPAEAELLRRSLRPCDVLKVGHHGSASSTGEAFLQALDPQIAVVSVGRHNRYGHPAPVVIDRLQRRGVAIFRTDRDGAVMISTDGHAITVQTAADDTEPSRPP